MKIGPCFDEEYASSFSGRSIADNAALKIVPEEIVLPMEKDEFDYWRIKVENLQPGLRYFYSRALLLPEKFWAENRILQ